MARNKNNALLIHLFSHPLPYTEREWLQSLFDHLTRDILSKSVEALFTTPTRMVLSIQSVQNIDMLRFDEATAWLSEKYG